MAAHDSDGIDDTVGTRLSLLETETAGTSKMETNNEISPDCECQ